MGAVGPDFDLEAPIWWDPKARRSIYDPHTFRLGLLLLRGDVVTVATVRGVVCSAHLVELRASWPGVFDLPMCDLTVAGHLYRIYFCAPHPRSPQFHARIPPAVTAVLEASGRAGRLATAAMPAARWPSQLTEPMGRRRMEAFRHTIERAGTDTGPGSLAAPPSPPSG